MRFHCSSSVLCAILPVVESSFESYSSSRRVSRISARDIEAKLKTGSVDV